MLCIFGLKFGAVNCLCLFGVTCYFSSLLEQKDLNTLFPLCPYHLIPAIMKAADWNLNILYFAFFPTDS